MRSKIFTQLLMFFQNLYRPIYRKCNVFIRNIYNTPLLLLRNISHKINSKISTKERSSKDYFKIKKTYISKRLVLISIIFLIVGSFFSYMFLKQKGILTSTFYDNEPIKYTGKAKIYDNNKNLLFYGNLDNGLYSGYGELYYKDAPNVLKYSGNFKNGNYQGFGILYRKDGNVLYKGDFSNGKYSGSGDEFHTNGKIRFTGTFKEGLYQDYGKMYNDTGILLAEGNFDKGLLNGDGRTYYSTSILKYDGNYVKNLYDGEGTLYSETAKIIYKGTFKAGLYDGKGILFSNDGIKIFEGDFKNNLYDGEGSLYNPKGELIFSGKFTKGFAATGIISPGKENELKNFSGNVTIFADDKSQIKKYEGSLKNNKYEGRGTLYFGDENNTIQYEGLFKDNKFHGIGTLYDLSRAIIYTGYFKDGSTSPEEFIGKSDAELDSIIGKPDNVVTKENGDYLFIYNKLNLKFVLDKHNEVRVLKVKSIIISSIIDVFNININMNKSAIITKLGSPSSAITIAEPLPQAPTNSVVNSNPVINQPTQATITTLLYYIDNYQITLSFSGDSIIATSIEVSLKPE